MNQSDLKNMIVLKNLPSNIVEEAIIVLKANKKVKNLEKIEKNKTIDNKQNIKKALQKVQIKGIIYKDNLFLLRRIYGEEKNSSAYIK